MIPSQSDSVDTLLMTLNIMPLIPNSMEATIQTISYCNLLFHCAPEIENQVQSLTNVRLSQCKPLKKKTIFMMFIINFYKIIILNNLSQAAFKLLIICLYQHPEYSNYRLK